MPDIGCKYGVDVGPGHPRCPTGLHGALWGSVGVPFGPVEPHGAPWVPMGPHVVPCGSMRPHGTPWGPMRPHAALCGPIGIQGVPWGCVGGPWALAHGPWPWPRASHIGVILAQASHIEFTLRQYVKKFPDSGEPLAFLKGTAKIQGLSLLRNLSKTLGFLHPSKNNKIHDFATSAQSKNGPSSDPKKSLFEGVLNK